MKTTASGVLLLILLTATASAVWAQLPGPLSPEQKQRVDAIVGKMTTEEKIDYIGGTGFGVRAMPRLGLPAFEMSDGPLGVRSNQRFPSTVYAAGIGLAATWNPHLAEQVGEGIGKDARARGIHFMLGPGVNIYRSPTNGRNFEYFGEDPFLTSAIAVGYITGMQNQGVCATVKHFLANSSEYLRHDSDSIVDERTLREIYLPAFEAAVKRAHVGAIMDSYNLINGLHATQNGYFNTDIARREWGFDGVMMSDWVATYDAAAANAGLDLEMPTGAYMNRKNLLPALEDGRLRMDMLDTKVARIVGTAERFGWLDGSQKDLALSTYNQQNHQVALQSARESVVLLKNAGDLLPLDSSRIKSVLVVGPGAYPAQPVGGGSGAAIPFSAVSVLEGLSRQMGTFATVYYEPGLPSVKDAASRTEFQTEAQNSPRGLKYETYSTVDLSGVPKSVAVVRHINSAGASWDDIDWDDLGSAISSKSSPSSHRWSGYYMVLEAGEFEIAAQGPGESAGYRVILDGKTVINDWDLAIALQDHITVPLTAGPHRFVVEDYQTGRFGGRMRVAIAGQHTLVSESALKLAAKADVVVIAAGFNPDSESEGADRTFGLPFGQDELIREIAAQNKHVVVAITSGGGFDMTSWINQVPALLELWYPGEAGGTALAEILLGAVNPSGHLPATFEKSAADNPAFASYYPEPGTKRVVYKEGIFVGYRGYEKNETQPQFPFGYGLSYTTFRYSALKIQSLGTASVPAFAVSFDITNTGSRAGAEVAQVYVGDKHAPVPRPAKELKAFAKVSLQPGETRRVIVPLDARSLSYYDVGGKQWHAEAGTFQVMVGGSSAQIAVAGELTLPEAVNSNE